MVDKKLHFRYRPLALIGKKKFIPLILFAYIFSLLAISISALYLIHPGEKGAQSKVLGASASSTDFEESENNIILLTPTPKVEEENIEEEAEKANSNFTPEPTPTPTKSLTSSVVAGKEYTAEKIGDTTYKIPHTSSDDKMASAHDIYNALNSYRGRHGRGNLAWDGTLATLAQDRANTFSSNGTLDSHAGFRSYMDNDGFAKAGFNGLGENSAQLAGNMNGERIINEIFGADADHDGNQLDNWTHVGVGVNGYYVNVNFGKNKR